MRAVEHNAYGILTGMKRRDEAGYTIVEVLIVLSVTMVLFFAVTVTFAGRNGQTELNQAVGHMESYLQGVANDVVNGYYPNGFTCTAPIGGGDIVITGVAASPGTNVGCAFLGKGVAFDTANAATFTVLGRQFTRDVGSPTAETLALARPQGTATGAQPYVNQYGLEATRIVDIANPGNQYTTLVFISQLGGGVDSANPLSGSRVTNIYGLAGTASFSSNAAARAGIVNAGSLVLLPEGARLCFTGGNGQKARITVGETGNQLSTTVTTDSGVGSECP